MKRLIKVILLALVGMLLLSCTALAVESNIDEYNKEYDVEKIYEYIDGETAQLLEEFGISEINARSIFSITPDKGLGALFNISTMAINKPIKFLVVAIGVILLSSTASAFLPDNEIVGVVGSSALALCSATAVAELVSTAISVLQSLLFFTTGFAGIFSVIVSSTGSVNVGISYGALTVFINTILSGLLVDLSQPIVNALCSLGFLSCFDFYSYTERLSSLVKKVYVFLLSLAGTIFSGIVTLKGVVGGSIDSLGSRGAQFVIGQSLPIVGGAVSETYATLITSLSLIKNTVGVFGIITVIVIILPILLELFCWVFAFEVSLNIAQATGINKAVGLMSILKDALTLLISTIVILTAVFIVSVGVCIAVKGSAV